jgi:thiosulfate/3-mercaptopyruvate sulfurtransferase
MEDHADPAVADEVRAAVFVLTMFNRFKESAMRIRFSLLAATVMISVLVSACAGLSAPPTGASQPAAASEPAVATIANPDALVDTAWVAAHLDDPNVRLLAIAGNREDYDAGHLPNAIYINLGEDLTNPADSTQGQILTQEALGELFSRLGIENDDTLVVYDGNNNLLAARAYWVFKYYQHPDVRLYDGGAKQWVANGNSLSTEPVTALAPTTYVPNDADPTLTASSEYVLAHLDDPETVLCDARGPGEYAGTDVRAARGGHIPGAINVDWVQAVDTDAGTFRDVTYLADLYWKAGFDPSKQVITYCQTGVRGAHTWFVLSELLGYPNVRNYDGSWVEWGNDPEKPIEQ